MEGLQKHADAADRPPLRVLSAAVKRLVDYSKAVENTEGKTMWQKQVDEIQSRMDALRSGSVSDKPK